MEMSPSGEKSSSTGTAYNSLLTYQYVKIRMRRKTAGSPNLSRSLRAIGEVYTSLSTTVLPIPFFLFGEAHGRDIPQGPRSRREPRQRSFFSLIPGGRRTAFLHSLEQGE